MPHFGEFTPSARLLEPRDVLGGGGLVRRRREGRRVFYELADGHLGVLLKEG